MSDNPARSDLASHPALTTPPICGNTALDTESERAIRIDRAEKGGSSDGGCGRQLKWIHAYRCLECGRWMHDACLRQHFVARGDRAADAQQRADSAEEAWRFMNHHAESLVAEVARLRVGIQSGLIDRGHGWTACRGCGMEWAPGRAAFHQADCWLAPLLAALANDPQEAAQHVE